MQVADYIVSTIIGELEECRIKCIEDVYGTLQVRKPRQLHGILGEVSPTACIDTTIDELWLLTADVRTRRHAEAACRG